MLFRSRKVKEGEKRTKMDLNFVEDFENLPIPLGDNEWNLLKRSLHNDAAFLSKCNIVDYSILLVISRFFSANSRVRSATLFSNILFSFH